MNYIQMECKGHIEIVKVSLIFSFIRLRSPKSMTIKIVKVQRSNSTMLVDVIPMLLNVIPYCRGIGLLQAHGFWNHAY